MSVSSVVSRLPDAWYLLAPISCPCVSLSNFQDVADESQYWLRQFLFLFLVAALIQISQGISGLLLWRLASSPVLLAFGLDALVGASRELVMARRIVRWKTADVARGADRRALSIVGSGYLVAGITGFVAGVVTLFRGVEPQPTMIGVALAALSMLLIPIVGSYMKSVAMELKSPALKAASVFTFANSYLSLVLLISLLIRSGMERWWGDSLGAIVMAPFIIQKGIQILVDDKQPEFDGGEGDSQKTG